MSRYQHTQLGYAALIPLGIGIAIVAALLAFIPEIRLFTGILLGVLAFVVILFASLRVEVTNDYVVASFGIGIIRRSIRRTDIRDARVVRNKWWYGWGVKRTPHGWMFNVSGFDAVELEFKSGKKFRIGTNEPDRLLAAIQGTRH